MGRRTPLRHLQDRGSPSVLGESTHPLSKCTLWLGEIEARPWTGAKNNKNLGVLSSQPYRSWGARGEEEDTRAHTSVGGSSPSARNAGRRAMAHRGTKWRDRVHESSGFSRGWMESGSATRFGDPPLQGRDPPLQVGTHLSKATSLSGFHGAHGGKEGREELSANGPTQEETPIPGAVSQPTPGGRELAGRGGDTRVREARVDCAQEQRWRGVRGSLPGAHGGCHLPAGLAGAWWGCRGAVGVLRGLSHPRQGVWKERGWNARNEGWSAGAARS